MSPLAKYTVHKYIFLIAKHIIPYIVLTLLTIRHTTSGADPGFFSGGGAPLRNDDTDSELKNF